MQSTSWNLVRSAAAGDEDRRAEFAARYSPAIRKWLERRWTGRPLAGALDDAVQEVFVECFKPSGALSSVDPDHEAGFRKFLRGVVVNVARRHEDRSRRLQRSRDAALVADGVRPPPTSLSRVLDREWARQMVREAAREQEQRARELGPAAVLRVELLRLRFHDGRSIGEIAAQLQQDAAYLHHQYAKARRDFRSALRRVLRRRSGGDAGRIEELTEQLMELLE
ncbi:MAG: sigma-70 family RNA polymerase sigma factor [Planctomycetes bacterium]|nr:sigma-70 family RNA polymerase sigma factor [Planctomycetota bacterium]